MKNISLLLIALFAICGSGCIYDVYEDDGGYYTTPVEHVYLHDDSWGPGYYHHGNHHPPKKHHHDKPRKPPKPVPPHPVTPAPHQNPPPATKPLPPHHKTNPFANPKPPPQPQPQPQPQNRGELRPRPSIPKGGYVPGHSGSRHGRK